MKKRLRFIFSLLYEDDTVILLIGTIRIKTCITEVRGSYSFSVITRYSNSQYETARGRYGGGAPVEGVAKAATSGRSEGKAFPFNLYLDLQNKAILFFTNRSTRARILLVIIGL